ncbi:MAG: Pycsar system effector family protein [Candidatus Binatia bacterium]
METEEAKLGVYFQILNGIQEQIRFADSKAAFVAAINALLFGFMATNFESLKIIYRTYGLESFAFWAPFVVLIVYAVASLLSLIFSILGVYSRFGDLAPQARVFFGHIAKAYGRDYEKYIRDTINMTAADWARELGTQIVEVSQIASVKHKMVRRAAISVVIAAFLWTLLFVVLLLMTPMPKV